MRRRLALIASAAVLVGGAGSALVVTQASSRSGSERQFTGYWMGIDPLDGGDSRRAITRGDDRTFDMIGRDTVFTLCDGTDRAIVTLAGAKAKGSALVSDDFTITCTNNGSAIRLKYRFELVDRHVARETVTRQDGEPVDEILFHRMSAR